MQYHPLTGRSIIVVKFPVSNLSDSRVDSESLHRLACDITRFSEHDFDFVIVTSNWPEGQKYQAKPYQMSRAAEYAVSRPIVTDALKVAFEQSGRQTAHLMLKLQDLFDEETIPRFNKLVLGLLAHGTIPIIEEGSLFPSAHDPDNDKLAATVAEVIGANLAIFITDSWGFYTAKSRNTNLPQQYAFIKELQGRGRPLNEIIKAFSDTELLAIVIGRKNRGSLADVFNGRAMMRIFRIKHPSRRKLRLAGLPLSTGRLHVDDGAKEAIVGDGASLLPVGVERVEGYFTQGDLVSIVDSLGKEFARGISEYTSKEVHFIRGGQSSGIEKLLDDIPFSEEVVHRNNMILVDELLPIV